MTQVNISLPPIVEEYLNQQITQLGYNNLEEYIYQLILEDQKRNNREKLETMLI
ncbi:hypothetical protein [Nostoc sp. UHCC 0870]|uniref:hypothetical protein n=1 Tax=Nostoc sp. UHCC 0870 TaxID=2914041 RepID=UPI001EDCAC25|nr:hypothetical protein [Nostoc sp. UHCC 0870]UKO98372.1 hypothetical protein L6494_01090 [Nostoc sp. UHCC 0870]